MGHHSYEEAKREVFKGFWILLFVTLAEVTVSLFGKLYLVPKFGESGATVGKVLMFIVGFFLIAFSLYKARFIVFEFMHMKYEAKGLALTVLLPTLLLVWAIIAFFQEGNSWKTRRQDIEHRNELKQQPAKQQGGVFDLRDKNFFIG